MSCSTSENFLLRDLKDIQAGEHKKQSNTTIVRSQCLDELGLMKGVSESDYIETKSSPCSLLKKYISQSSAYLNGSVWTK